MRAIRGIFTGQGVQMSFELRSAGYREILDLTNIYKPIPGAIQS
jgi:hypothetical protein